MLRRRFLIILAYILLNSCRSSICESNHDADQNSTMLLMECTSSLENCSCYINQDIETECNKTRVTNLTVEYLSVTSFPPNFFDDLTTLKFIDLLDNAIEVLPKRLFSKLDLLIRVFIAYTNRDNYMEVRSDDLFANHSQIEEIHFLRNTVSTLSKDFLNGTRNLRILNLSHNLLTNLPEQIFDTLYKLEILFLNGNKLISLSENQFLGTPNLIALDLSSNRINILNGTFINKNKIKILDLNKNELSLTTNETILYVNGLLEIDLSENILYRLPENIFQHMQNLQVLNLSMSHLTSLSQRQFINLTKLRELDLSRNNLRTIPEKIFQYQYKLQTLILDSNHLMRLPDDLFINTIAITSVSFKNNKLAVIPANLFKNNCNLRLVEFSSNQLKSLPEDLFQNARKIKEIAFDDNNLTNISYYWILLDISHNKLKTLDAKTIERLRKMKHMQLRLVENDWNCECEFRQFIHDESDRIDLPNTTCTGILLLLLCSWKILLISFLGFIAFVISLAATFKYQTEILVFLYAHGCFRFSNNDEPYDESKKYDAFISYSHKDEDFVVRLASELENGPIKFKLCIHCKDWLPGDYILDQIARSVEQSRRTIVVLSKHFLQSVWGRMEFRTAHKFALKERRVRLVIIIYGDIGNIDELDADLKAYLRTNTYIKWNENGSEHWFFDKLRYTLPHPPQDKQNADKEQDTQF